VLTRSLQSSVYRRVVMNGVPVVAWTDWQKT